MDPNKELLLEKELEFLTQDHVLDYEFAGGDENEICIWTVEKLSSFTSILLHYIRWHGEFWVDKNYSELEGPALLTCPIRFFSYKVDEETLFPQWRYEVKKYHENIGPQVQNPIIGLRLIKSLMSKGKQNDS